MEFLQISTRNYGCGTEVWILFGHGLAVKKMLTGRIPGIPGILLMDEILGGAGFCPSTVPLGCIPDFFLNSGECVQDQ